MGRKWKLYSSSPYTRIELGAGSGCPIKLACLEFPFRALKVIIPGKRLSKSAKEQHDSRILLYLTSLKGLQRQPHVHHVSVIQPRCNECRLDCVQVCSRNERSWQTCTSLEPSGAMPEPECFQTTWLPRSDCGFMPVSLRRWRVLLLYLRPACGLPGGIWLSCCARLNGFLFSFCLSDQMELLLRCIS